MTRRTEERGAAGDSAVLDDLEAVTADAMREAAKAKAQGKVTMFQGLDVTDTAGARSHTKVVATIGPASEARIGELIDAGMHVARVNMSHESHEDHTRRIALLRHEAEKRGVALGILADIQGPKMRLGLFETGWLDVTEGEVYRLSEGKGIARPGEILFNLDGFEVSVEPGHRIFLNDGIVQLVVEESSRGAKLGRVLRPGRIGDRKGVHLPDSHMRIELPTEKDRADLELIRDLGVDMVGISFVSGPEDVLAVRALVPEALLVSKIERLEALQRIEEILAVTDGIMVARGDLGVEVNLETLPLVQKSLLQAALRAGRFTITATEMLESMVHVARPTRAEVTDVANAVFDGTDAVMLSAETAVGDFPVEAVKTMNKIACAVERSQRYHDLPRVGFRETERSFSNAIAMVAAEAAEALGISKILCFTESGDTVRLLSRYRPSAEIVALTPHERTLNAMTILAHVTPVLCPRRQTLHGMLGLATETMMARGIVREGEEVVVVAGVPPGRALSTNMMKLHRIGDPSFMP